MNLVEEAITGHWGERCPEHEDGCPVCDAWRQYDNLTTHNEMHYKALNNLTREKEMRMAIMKLIIEGRDSDMARFMALSNQLPTFDELEDK
jgi:hypothetical protein